MACNVYSTTNPLIDVRQNESNNRKKNRSVQYTGPHLRFFGTICSHLYCSRGRSGLFYLSGAVVEKELKSTSSGI